VTLQEPLFFFDVSGSGARVVEFDVLGDSARCRVGSEVGALLGWRVAVADGLECKCACILQRHLGIVADRDALALGADHDLPGLGALWVDAQAEILRTRIPKRDLLSDHRLGSARDDIGKKDFRHSLRIVSEIGEIEAV
jgi:hypothetical protein